MEERFVKLFERIGSKGDPKKEFNRLKKLYSRPKRFYHTLEGHINDCLGEFDLVKSQIFDKNEVEFAIWYHDAIYDSKSNNNEEKSAEIAYNVCISCGLSSKFSQNVKDLILITKHTNSPKNINQKYIIDIDLSSLGKSLEEFNLNYENIRKEYSWVPEKQFKEGRIKILSGFLKRQNIYFTSSFRERYELNAQKNLKDSIEQT